MNNLIEAIKQKQRDNSLSDNALALFLGIDRSTWSYIKSGKRNPGMKFLAATADKFPELKRLVDEEIYHIPPRETPPTPLQRLGAFIKKVIRKGGKARWQK